MTTRVQELRILVEEREEEYDYASWKLTQARKRLEQAVAEEWAEELEMDAAKRQCVQRSNAPEEAAASGLLLTTKKEELGDGEKVKNDDGKKLDDGKKDEEPISVKEEPESELSEADYVEEEVDPHVADAAGGGANSMSWRGPPKANKITAENLLNFAKQADQQNPGMAPSESPAPPAPTAEDFHKMNLPVPPPPLTPPDAGPAPLCPVKCRCGRPCTRVERMLEQQAKNMPGARTRLRHHNHTCSSCQAVWYYQKSLRKKHAS